MEPASTKNAYAALQVAEFRLFIAARFLVTLAIQIQTVVVGWQIYALTNDPLSLGLIGLAEALPSITVSLYAGHVADVVRRKKIIVSSVTVLLVCSALLFSFVWEPTFIPSLGVWPIYAVIFLSGIARGFIVPAYFAFMPQLVSRDLLSNAITWNSSFWQTASIAGPAIGGALYGFIGLDKTYLVDICLMISALVLFSMIRSKPLPKVTEKNSIFEKIASGLRFVFSNKIMLGALSLDLFAVLFGGAVALLPIFAKEILEVGPQGLGILRSAPSVGALLVAIYLAHRPIEKHMGRILLLSVAGFGLCMIGFALSTEFWLSLIILVISGAFDGVSVIIRGTILQILTPEHMKGRVSAVNNIFVGSSNEIGAFESGLAAKYMGTVPSVVFGGFMTLLIVGLIAWTGKSLRKLQKLA